MYRIVLNCIFLKNNLKLINDLLFSYIFVLHICDPIFGNQMLHTK